MFAGPNGSGKSTIKEVVPANLLGIYLNADDIEKQIKQDGWFDLRAYEIQATAAQLIEFFQHSNLLVASELNKQLPLLRGDGHRIDFRAVCNDKSFSYFASVLVDFLRQQLLQHKISFTFETVMSHRSKVDFLKLAQQEGYRTYLYFVATVDPDINVSRVENRVKLGGHWVEPDKVHERYYRSLELLMDAIGYSNRAYIFDNSIADDSADGKTVWLAEVTNGEELELQVDVVPWWFKTYVLDKF